eukprot:XP_015571383.1 uncharacterized protein LOC107260846 [Ricinus communis]
MTRSSSFDLVEPLSDPERSLRLLRKHLQSVEEEIEVMVLVDRLEGMENHNGNAVADANRTMYEFARPSLDGTQTIQASSKVKDPGRQKVKPIPIGEYQPKIPYPARLKQVEAQEHFSKLLDILRQLHINLPFIDVLKQMLKYAKFLKDILSSKSKLEEVAYVKLNEECSTVFQNHCLPHYV